MLNISRSIETTFLYIANVLFSLVRNNPYCIFFSLYFTISSNGISRHPEIYFNAVMSNCFMICGKGEFAFLYHLLQRKYNLLFSPFAVFLSFMKSSFNETYRHEICFKVILQITIHRFQFCDILD